MPIVGKKKFVNGEVASASDLNQSYDDLETASSSVDDSNTASSWMTMAHIENATKQCNRFDSYKNDANVTTNFNNTSYVTIAPGGMPAEIGYTGFQPQQYEATRFCASGLVSIITAAVELGLSNYYAFRLLLTYSDNGGPASTLTLGEWGYSFTPRARVTIRTTGTTAGDIQYQTFQFSTVHRNDQATGVRQYLKVELQVKVNDNANSVGVTRHQIFSISGRA